MLPLTCEPPPGGAAAGQLHHTRGKHEAEEQPTHQPEGDAVVWTPGCGTPLEQAQRGHEHGQEACFQQEAVPGGGSQPLLSPWGHGLRPRGDNRGTESLKERVAGEQSPHAEMGGCMRADLPLEVEEDLSYLRREPAVSGREGGREPPPVLHEVSFLSPSPQRAPPPSALPVLCQTQEWQ